MLILYVNIKVFNKNNIFEVVGCVIKNMFFVKMLLFSYMIDKLVKIIYLLDSGINEYIDL